jgi:glycolate oxidase
MAWAWKSSTACAPSSPRPRTPDVRAQGAFDPQSLLNPGKVIPTLNRCAEYGKMLVRGGQIAHPDLPRF